MCARSPEAMNGLRGAALGVRPGWSAVRSALARTRGVRGTTPSARGGRLEVDAKFGRPLSAMPVTVVFSEGALVASLDARVLLAGDVRVLGQLRVASSSKPCSLAPTSPSLRTARVEPIPSRRNFESATAFLWFPSGFQCVSQKISGCVFTHRLAFLPDRGLLTAGTAGCIRTSRIG